MLKNIHTPLAPEAVGPYSQAIQCQDLLFVSGQLPIDPTTGQFASSEIKAQTRQSLENIQQIIQAAGFTKKNVVKCTVYLKDMAFFSEMNAVYQQFFEAHKPARVAVEVSRLPKDALVEIDAICHL